MQPRGWAASARNWASMVKLHHSVFALPFALTGAILAAVNHGVTGRQVFWIVVAMVAARNAAMGFNRLADHAYDARNPRTSTRELPAGKLSRAAVSAFTVALAVLFVFAAFQLNPLCGVLSPVALAVVLGYSFTKRFTWASHLMLGLSLAMAPMGGWLAIRGSFSWTAWLLAAAVLLWVAGFDVIYACQDVEFDRREGLHSIPARFGIRPALATARCLHAGALLAMTGVGVAARLHPVYGFGLAGIALLLLWEHRLVRADDLSRVGVAFFNMNGVISIVYLAVTLAAVLIPGVSG